MDTIKEGNFEQSRHRSSSNPVDRTRTSTWKKKRLSRLSETELEVYKLTSMHVYHISPWYLRTYFKCKQNVYCVHLEPKSLIF